ncbi:MAG: TetR/AcrR family transcriptional regulator [Candidatus Marithrix sp.]
MAHAKFSTSLNALNAIFHEAIPLFAQSGFDGVSMRHIAKAVGVSIATIYYHFPDKQTLYLRCIEEAFANKTQVLSDILAVPGTPEQQLQQFIYQFTDLMASDTHFRRLMQRELLDGDETRLRVLAKNVFQTQFQDITELAKILAPNCDAHLMAISMVGLVIFHLEMTPIRPFLPGGRAEHNEVEFIAKHVTQLLLKGILQYGNN